MSQQLKTLYDRLACIYRAWQSSHIFGVKHLQFLCMDRKLQDV